ncbi:MAG: tetratricopeptide repeat protein [Casimicrobiaceae bacterium]
MIGAARAAPAALLAIATFAMPVRAAPADDFSARLDSLWDFGAPAVSEARFRGALAEAAPRSREAYETSTQLARALGLQRKFAAADAVLDGVQAALDSQTPRVRVRYLLERGRVRNTSGAAQHAVPLFEDALAASARDTLAGADFYRVDALHMLGIAAPAGEQLDWNLKALAAADASTDARTRGWRASLLNNIGWAYHDRGEHQRALDHWQKAVAAREAAGGVVQIRVARWTVARGLRSLGRLDEAEAIQRALARELEAAASADGYVYEELAEIALARNDPAAAKPWAAKAYALLKDDASLRSGESARLARLAGIAGVEVVR